MALFNLKKSFQYSAIFLALSGFTTAHAGLENAQLNTIITQLENLNTSVKSNTTHLDQISSSSTKTNQYLKYNQQGWTNLFTLKKQNLTGQNSASFIFNNMGYKTLNSQINNGSASPSLLNQIAQQPFITPQQNNNSQSTQPSQSWLTQISTAATPKLLRTIAVELAINNLINSQRLLSTTESLAYQQQMASDMKIAATDLTRISSNIRFIKERQLTRSGVLSAIEQYTYSHHNHQGL